MQLHEMLFSFYIFLSLARYAPGCVLCYFTLQIDTFMNKLVIVANEIAVENAKTNIKTSNRICNEINGVAVMSTHTNTHTLTNYRQALLLEATASFATGERMIKARQRWNDNKIWKIRGETSV